MAIQPETVEIRPAPAQITMNFFLLLIGLGSIFPENQKKKINGVGAGMVFI